ncbi:hypothetical protein ACRAWD_06650 [Caulobacter segnis]
MIAHSLGTAVAHDTVAQLARLTQTPVGADLGPIPAPRALVMVANVACLLTDDPSVLYADTLSPIGAGHPTDYVAARTSWTRSRGWLFQPRLGSSPRYAGAIEAGRLLPHAGDHRRPASRREPQQVRATRSPRFQALSAPARGPGHDVAAAAVGGSRRLSRHRPTPSSSRPTGTSSGRR